MQRIDHLPCYVADIIDDDDEIVSRWLKYSQEVPEADLFGRKRETDLVSASV